MNIVIEHNTERHQFFSIIENAKAQLDYAVLPDGKTLDYISTYVPPELRGRKIAGQIFKFALDYAEENKYKVIPTCSYVRAFIEDHPEYKNLMVEFYS